MELTSPLSKVFSLPDLRDSHGPSGNQDDLFRFLTQRLEFHFEQRLKTAAVLSQL